jgi:hypothetical protein
MEGNPIAEVVGWLEARPEDAIFVRPMGPSTWEIGFDRPSEDIAAVEVVVDDEITLTDAVSGMERSPRGAVLYAFSRLGERALSVSAYTAEGDLYDERRFAVTLR